VGSWSDLLHWIFPPVNFLWDNERPPRELVELVVEERVKPCRVLDVGCGTTSYVIYLASKGFDAVGIDVSSLAIKKARVKAAKKNVRCRFHAVDFLDVQALSNVITEPFDLVMDYCCLNSISVDDRGLYPHSLKYVTHPESLYLFWASLPESINFGNGWNCVDPMEARELFSKDFSILEERDTNRQKILYILGRRRIDT